jgi:hypothetical protein
MGTTSVPGWSSRPGRFLPLGQADRAREPMARRSFVVVDVTEILIHWHAGRSINEVSAAWAWT